MKRGMITISLKKVKALYITTRYCIDQINLEKTKCSSRCFIIPCINHLRLCSHHFTFNRWCLIKGMGSGCKWWSWNCALPGFSISSVTHFIKLKKVGFSKSTTLEKVTLEKKLIWLQSVWSHWRHNMRPNFINYTK